MHPELSRPGKLVHTAHLPVPVETAWQLLTEPGELLRWRGDAFQRAETGRAQGTPIVIYGWNSETPFQQIGKILCWEPPYQWIYSYWHSQPGLSNGPRQQVTIAFQLIALPRNQSMLYLTQTGFHPPFTFEQADQYWREALTRLRRLYGAEA